MRKLSRLLPPSGALPAWNPLIFRRSWPPSSPGRSAGDNPRSNRDLGVVSSDGTNRHHCSHRISNTDVRAKDVRRTLPYAERGFAIPGRAGAAYRPIDLVEAALRGRGPGVSVLRPVSALYADTIARVRALEAFR